MALTKLGTIRERVRYISGEFPAFSGDNELGETQLDGAIRQAVNEFSHSVPYTIIEDETGDSGKYYPLSDLASWEDDFSRIVSIDYDAGTRVSGDELPQYLVEDDEEWFFYRDASTRYFVFRTKAPDSGVTFRVEYTLRHTLNDQTSTIPNRYDEAITFLSASYLALMVQFHVEKSLDPPAGAQFVTMRTKGSGFASIAKAYRDMYVKAMGGEGVVAASVVRDFDQRYATGEHYIFHAGSIR
tara:strand:- start:890 stop:1615 length:726 start_codon:yes stop_codon:yes gene_type:complete